MALHRTVYQVEVLSLVPPNDMDDLDQIAYDIREGEASGSVTRVSTEEVTPERMAELLTAQGSDPSFLLGDDYQSFGEQRDQWQPGETAVFRYSLDPNDATSEIAARIGHRTGEVVTVLAEQDPDGNRAEFATLQERADAGALVTYRVRFPDGHEDVAFEDELHDGVRDEIQRVGGYCGTKDVPELQTDEVLNDARKRDDAFPSLVDFSEDPDVL